MDKKIEMLSGGEKARLKLCEILKKEPNLLLLDEPTNHMDIIGKESLENILKEYEGSLIFVSHDRYFVSKIANKILEFTKEGVRFFDGNYKEYQDYKETNKKQFETDRDNKNEINTKLKQEKSSKNQYLLNKEKTKRKNKMIKLETEIDNLENEIVKIKAEMEKQENITDYIKLNELQKQINKLNEEIEIKMAEWEKLNNSI